MSNVLQTIREGLVRFETANNSAPNVIVLGPDECLNFSVESYHAHPAQRRHFEEDGIVGMWYRGCRVVRSREPGVLVGRVVGSLK